MDSKGIFNTFDYNLVLQIADGQVMFWQHGGLELCLIPTEWHKRGKLLYAVAVPNPRFYFHNNCGKKTVQRWKIIDYKHIRDAFMTADEVEKKYGIAPLPKGSKASNNDWIAHKREIDILGDANEFEEAICWQLERGTPKIVQSQIQKEKKNDNHNCIVASISRDEFVQCAIDSLHYAVDNFVHELPCIAQIDSKKCRYHIEKLLPVYLYQYNAHVLLQVMLKANGSLKITSIGLDFIDICNKANLIGDASQHPILNLLRQSVDELYIYDDQKSDYPHSIDSSNSSISIDEYVVPNCPQSPPMLAPNSVYALMEAAHLMVMGKTAEERKMIIGERLYPIIAHWQPRLAGKITAMLLEMSDMEPLVLLYDSEALTDKINEAVAVLKNHQLNQYKQAKEM